MSLKELALLIVTTFFPIEEHSSYIGYCVHDFASVRKDGNTYTITDYWGGVVYTDEATYEWFARRAPDPGIGHNVCLRIYRYSWGPFVTLDETRVPPNPARCTIRR